MKIGLSGQIFDQVSVWEHLEAAAREGYEVVELRSTHVSPATPPSELEAIRAFLAEKGIIVSGLSCFVGNFALLTEAECEAALEVFEAYVALADFFAADTIRVWPRWIDSHRATGEMWDRAVRWMRRCSEIAAAHGRRIVMEMHHGTLCDCAESSLRLVNGIGLKNIGLTLDPVNLYQTGSEYGALAVARLGRRIFNVHIKDIVLLKSGAEEGSFPCSFYAKHIGRFTPVEPPIVGEERYYAHRMIGQGGVDWADVIQGLRDAGYEGCITVESVKESSPRLPGRGELAAECMRQVRSLLGRPMPSRDWRVVSPEAEGFHRVIAPGLSDCRVVSIYRLNLRKGHRYTLASGKEEMNTLLVKGAARAEGEGLDGEMAELDSFYIPGGSSVQLTAREDVSFYIGAAPCEGVGKAFFRRYEPELPLGEIHQVHGSGSGRREVFFTLNPEVPASPLICGFSESTDGGWTSWPPHQHENDLEEVYCYFGMPAPQFGLHIAYAQSGRPEDMAVHPVRDGVMVLAPRGYHSTVASPGTRNRYFWVLASFSQAQRLRAGRRACIMSEILMKEAHDAQGGLLITEGLALATQGDIWQPSK